MLNVIGVKFRSSGRVYYFDPLELDIKVGDGVIVETARGVEFGDVVMKPHEVDDSRVVQPLKPVIRVATDEDREMKESYAAKEPQAFQLCQELITRHELDMKLVDVEYSFNGGKVVFYFTANERVDFRNLVKDLAFQFKTRIELRQIGVRDEANILGGLGSCGRPVCCKTFLDEFRPVSIKMAKEQNLSLSPTKISGLCGRLMCCLQYEQSTYETMRKLMPKLGSTVNTLDGVGTVMDNNIITEQTRVRIVSADGDVEVKNYHYTHIAPAGMPVPEIAQQAKNAKAAAEAEALQNGEQPAQPKQQRKQSSSGGNGNGNGQPRKARPKPVVKRVESIEVLEAANRRAREERPAAGENAAPSAAQKPNAPEQGARNRRKPAPSRPQQKPGEGNAAKSQDRPARPEGERRRSAEPNREQKPVEGNAAKPQDRPARPEGEPNKAQKPVEGNAAKPQDRPARPEGERRKPRPPKPQQPQQPKTEESVAPATYAKGEKALAMSRMGGRKRR